MPISRTEKKLAKRCFPFDKSKHTNDSVVEDNGGDIKEDVMAELETTDKSWIMADSVETKIGDNHMKVDTLLSSVSM